MSKIMNKVLDLEEKEADAQYVIVSKSELMLIDDGSDRWGWNEYETYANLQNAIDRAEAVDGRVAKLTFIGGA